MSGRFFLCFLLLFLTIVCKEHSLANPKRASKTGKEVRLIDLKEKSEWSRAVFAGGCFWCMEPPFDAQKGVKQTLSGYAGGPESHPSYRDVASGNTKHAEAILIEFDSKQVSYTHLVEIFWRNIDPTQKDGQFYDLGSQYRTAIFYADEEQKKIAKASKKKLEGSKRFDKPIVTEISPVSVFWKAEEYHQNYYQKNPVHYNKYKKASGREEFIKGNWKN